MPVFDTSSVAPGSLRYDDAKLPVMGLVTETQEIVSLGWCTCLPYVQGNPN